MTKSRRTKWVQRGGGDSTRSSQWVPTPHGLKESRPGWAGPEREGKGLHDIVA